MNYPPVIVDNQDPETGPAINVIVDDVNRSDILTRTINGTPHKVIGHDGSIETPVADIAVVRVQRTRAFNGGQIIGPLSSTPSTFLAGADNIRIEISASLTLPPPTTTPTQFESLTVAVENVDDAGVTLTLSGSYTIANGVDTFSIPAGEFVVLQMKYIINRWIILNSVTSAGVSGLVGPEGPAGETGATGATGRPAGLYYQFSSNTENLPADAKGIAFNHATLASVTEVRFRNINEDAADVSAFISTWDDSSSTIKGSLLIQNANAPANFVVFDVTAVSTPDGGHKTVSVTYVASNGSISDDDFVSVQFTRTGDAG